MAELHERGFIMIKPDGVQRGLISEIIKRFERKGFKLVALKFIWPPRELIEEHYRDKVEKPFYPSLIKYMSSGPLVPMIWEGLGIIKASRVMMGKTSPRDSAPGTIRGDLCVDIGRNGLHVADSIEEANRDINLWFKKEEIIDWVPATTNWLYRLEPIMKTN